MYSTSRHLHAEHCYIYSGAHLHATSTSTYLGSTRIPLLHPGIHIYKWSTSTSRHLRLVTYKHPHLRTTSTSTSTSYVYVQKQIYVYLVYVYALAGVLECSTCTSTGPLSTVLTRSRRTTATSTAAQGQSLFFVKGMLVAPLSTVV